MLTRLRFDRRPTGRSDIETHARRGIPRARCSRTLRANSDLVTTDDLYEVQSTVRLAGRRDLSYRARRWASRVEMPVSGFNRRYQLEADLPALLAGGNTARPTDTN